MRVAVRRWRLAVGLVAVVAMGGCTSGGPGGGATPSSVSTDRASVATAAATRVILPAYQDLAAAAGRLEEATAACSLERSRETLRATRVAYMRTFVANGLGPAKDQRLLPAIDFWPTDPAGVEAFVAGPGPFTIEAVAALGARQRGLPAIETLLAGQSFLERQRCQVANLLTTLVRRAVDDVVKAWTELAPRFGSEERGLAELVSSATQAIGLVEGDQLGMPYGLRRGSAVNPELVRGGNALGDSAAVIEGTQAALKTGVTPLLPPDAAQRLTSAVDAVGAAVKDIPPPLQLAVVSARPKVLAATQAGKAVEELLATEVSSALGITLSFNPNDGD